VFVIFQRLVKREEVEGTGAGLAIARQIVQMHNGKIWVDSKVGEGAVFTFTSPKIKTKENLMSDTHKIIRILLAEDNPDDIEITKKALKEAKIINALSVVRDGQEAVDYLLHKGAYQDAAACPKPGLILLDINLPKMNGLEVLKIIKNDADLKRIPVVMLTVSKRDEDILKSYNGGCNSFIQKPVNFENFIEIIKRSAYIGAS
jgi:CheY-like chemotaxis protein